MVQQHISKNVNKKVKVRTFKRQPRPSAGHFAKSSPEALYARTSLSWFLPTDFPAGNMLSAN